MDSCTCVMRIMVRHAIFFLKCIIIISQKDFWKPESCNQGFLENLGTMEKLLEFCKRQYARTKLLMQKVKLNLSGGGSNWVHLLVPESSLTLRASLKQY